MFFDDEDERFLNPDLFHVVRRELYAISSNLKMTPYGLRSVPTHTEDGIPIRKLYVSNLPPKTTRTELFGVFAPYGFIKSCWLRMGDKGANKSPAPTYAFVTYSNPADAHKALQAPKNEKQLRGRHLRISPADSWHQPVEDPDGRVRWKPRGQRHSDTHGSPSSEQMNPSNVAPIPETSSELGEGTSSEETSEQVVQNQSQEEESDSEPTYSILDILNRDCLNHVLTYVPIRDLIRSERVSKAWQAMVQEYLSGIRMFKTSWWQHVPVTLTTAVLRRVLARLGPALLRLHIDHHWSALNDRTAHTVGKFCPNLEELKIVGMHTKNWNPLIYGCKELKSLSFISCNKLTDASLVQLVKNDSCIESLLVANNTHVTGLFLTGSSPPKLTSLAFYNCYSLQGTVLSAAIDTIPTITCLKIDVCPVSMWKIIPTILKKLPKLEELSLSEYTSVELCLTPQGNEDFCQALGTLTELKVLDLSRNIYVTNAVLKQVAQSCPKLERLNVSSCNSRKTFPHAGVGDDGIIAITRSCHMLRRLDVSYLAALSDAGVAAVARLPALQALTARGNVALTAASLSTAIRACHHLEEVDVCGCDNVSEAVVEQAALALGLRPRPLALRLAGTAAAHADCLRVTPKKYLEKSEWDPELCKDLTNVLLPPQELTTHPLLTVDTKDDRSNPHLRPDFVDRVFEDSSEDSMDDFYDHDDYDDFLGADDELFLDEDIDDYDNLFAYGLHGPDIILL